MANKITYRIDSVLIRLIRLLNKSRSFLQITGAEESKSQTFSFKPGKKTNVFNIFNAFLILKA